MTDLPNRVPVSKKAQEILGKLISLAAPDELPRDFSENCDRIWLAFEPGKAYEKYLAGLQKEGE